ncbi:MAG: choice-of-anchor D domain-containing protein [Bdellovibrionales bacterium]|nr:choice-of-anchor D domain-containing protein [Bdellovibrionales bacterium]
MKKLKWMLGVMIFIFTVLIFHQSCGQFNPINRSLSSNSTNSINESSENVRRANCSECHNGSFTGNGPKDILNDQELIDKNYVIPGNPEASVLFQAVSTGRMPMGRANLSPEDINILSNWIVNLGLTVQNISPAKLEILDLPSNSYNFSSLVSGATAEHTFVLKNTGQKSAININSSTLGNGFSYKGGTYPGEGGDCRSELLAQQNCRLVISFSPTNVGSYSHSILLNYHSKDDSGEEDTLLSYVFSVSGSATAPPVPNLAVLSISPSAEPFAFDSKVLGDTVPIEQRFTISNTTQISASALNATPLINGPFSFKGGTFPGEGGTCVSGGSLSGNSSCQVVVSYLATTVAGSHSGALTINYNNGVDTTSVSRNLRGQTVVAGVASISADSGEAPSSDPVNFGSGVIGSSARELTLRVRNDAAAGGSAINQIEVTGLLAPFSFKGGSFPGTGGSCVARGSLAARASCTLVILFTPANGPLAHSVNITINYNNGRVNTSVVKALTAQTIAPGVASLSPTTLTFGQRTIGSGPTDLLVTLSNTSLGSSITNISGAALTSPFSYKGTAGFPGTDGTCRTNGSLAAGASCTIKISYSPASIAVSHSGSLTITYNNGATSTSVSKALTGETVAVGAATLTPAAVDFGSRAIGSSAVEQVITLSNTAAAGGSALSGLSGAALSGSFSYSGGGGYPGGGTCGTSLNVGSSCTIKVKYTPASSASAHTGTLTINYNNGAAARTATSSLTGRTVAVGVATLTPAAVDFGSRAIGSSAVEQVITLSNTAAAGGSALSGLSGAALSGSFSYSGGGGYPGGGTCGTSLNVGSSCTIKVKYTPASSASAHTGTLTINYNNGAAARTATSSLTGSTVSNALLEISPVNVLAVKVGERRREIITIRNSGGSAASGLSITTSVGGASVALSASSNATAFKYTGGTFPGTGGTCSSTLSGNSSCTISVDFSPTANGLIRATINVGYGNGISNQQTAFNISGRGAGDLRTRVYYSTVKSIISPDTNNNETDTTGCTGCHGMNFKTYDSIRIFKNPLGSSSTLSAIQGGINSRMASIIQTPRTTSTGSVQMGKGNYGSLTESQVQTILNWLAQDAPNDPPSANGASIEAQPFETLQGDRYYIASVLNKVYGSDASKVTPHVQKLSARADLFGSTCNPQDTTYESNSDLRVKKISVVAGASQDICPKVNLGESEMEATSNPVSTIMSEGVRASVCIKLSGDKGNIAVALSRANLLSQSNNLADINSSNLTKAFQRFYPGATPSGDVITKLTELGRAISPASGQNGVAGILVESGKDKLFEAWRMILMTLCLSSGWVVP